MKKYLRTIVAFVAASFLCGTAALFAQTEKPDALKLYSSGKYTEAINICEEELKNNPNNLDSYAVLCWALVANKQYSEAEQHGAAARKINPYDVRIMEVLGEAKYYLGKNNEALSLFQEYIANVPENGSRVGKSYYYMGQIYIQQARYEHADIALTAAVRSEPLIAYWWGRLGYAREMTGNWNSALTAYDKSLALDSTFEDAINGKARCQTHLQ
jgi:tetratricopeptide (TPR) repeat protein